MCQSGPVDGCDGSQYHGSTTLGSMAHVSQLPVVPTSVPVVRVNNNLGTIISTSRWSRKLLQPCRPGLRAERSISRAEHTAVRLD